MIDMLDGKDAMILLTEWRQFRQPDLAGMKKRLKIPVVFDGRNIYDHTKLQTAGFEHYCIGRGCVPQLGSEGTN